MIKSMTGFGRAEYSDGKRSILVEIKTVNHRYVDVSVRMPRRYAFAEEKLKNVVKGVARRGKIDLNIQIEHLTEDDVNIQLNHLVAKQYMENLRELKETFSLAGDVSLPFLASLPDVMKARADVEDEEELYASLLIPLHEALQNLDAMRMIEGAKLAEDIIARGKWIRSILEEIKVRSPQITAEYTEKLRARIQELLGQTMTVPEDRILLEAAIFADKCSITEELVRLDSHILQLSDIINKSNQPDGKKLDFLVQEMNREANTIGSKANDLTITSHVVEIKSEIEKIREQVQNIE